ncbi:MAG TPA: VanZ family protein [Candidatus Alectryocaccobium stercorigallinarum]|nr:VanZ family protein [Candidatus Alectryocaccobium stercorigallinarum]
MNIVARIFKIILSFIPAALIAFMIFNFSSQTSIESSSLSRKVTKGIVMLVDEITNSDWSEEEIDARVEKYEYYVRKGAHMTEYAILAFSVMLPLRACGLKGFSLFFMTMLICGGFAATDEYHQMFVSGRAAALKDVFIDCTGACIGCGFSGLLIWIMR